jgi:hypothetical protein
MFDDFTCSAPDRWCPALLVAALCDNASFVSTRFPQNAWTTFVSLCRMQHAACRGIYTTPVAKIPQSSIA